MAKQNDPLLHNLLALARWKKLSPPDVLLALFLADRPRLRFVQGDVATYLGLPLTQVHRSLKKLSQLGVVAKKQNASFYSIKPVDSWVSVLTGRDCDRE